MRVIWPDTTFQFFYRNIQYELLRESEIRFTQTTPPDILVINVLFVPR